MASYASANLLEFGSGGGGILGNDKNVTLLKVRVVEHAFERHDKLTKEVTETFEPGCMSRWDFEIEDPDDDAQKFFSQFCPIGNLPLSRLAELGIPGVPTRIGGPGGYRPSLDNENPSSEGPFVILEGKTDIWEGCQHAVMITELANLGAAEFAEKINAEGYAAFDGTRMLLGTKVMPKSRKAAADPTSRDKIILVPVKINSWPWEAKQAQAATPASAKPAAAKVKKSAAAPAPVAQAAPVAVAEAPSNGAGDARMIEIFRQVIAAEGGVIKRKDFPSRVFAAAVKEGPNRIKYTQEANKKSVIAAHSGTEWLWDEDSETIMELGK